MSRCRRISAACSCAAFAFGFGGIVALALLPLIARDLVKGGPLIFGVLLGAFGVGAVGGRLPQRTAAPAC